MADLMKIGPGSSPGLLLLFPTRPVSHEYRRAGGSSFSRETSSSLTDRLFQNPVPDWVRRPFIPLEIHFEMSPENIYGTAART